MSFFRVEQPLQGIHLIKAWASQVLTENMHTKIIFIKQYSHIGTLYIHYTLSWHQVHLLLYWNCTTCAIIRKKNYWLSQSELEMTHHKISPIAQRMRAQRMRENVVLYVPESGLAYWFNFTNTDVTKCWFSITNIIDLLIF